MKLTCENTMARTYNNLLHRNSLRLRLRASGEEKRWADQDMNVLPFDEDQRHRALVPYDPVYGEVYRLVAGYILESLPQVEVVHVGSTAIPGIRGKPMIDMLVVTEESDLRQVQSSLLDIGFHRRSVWTDMDEKPYVCGSVAMPTGRYNVNLHICRRDDENHNGLVEFRDYLNNNELSRNEYDAAKLAAHTASPRDAKGYNEAKEPVILGIMQRIKQQAQQSNAGGRLRHR